MFENFLEIWEDYFLKNVLLEVYTILIFLFRCIIYPAVRNYIKKRNKSLLKNHIFTVFSSKEPRWCMLEA